MDSNITEIIEEFMDSALAQWVCHSSFVTFRVKMLPFFWWLHPWDLFTQINPVEQIVKVNRLLYYFYCAGQQVNNITTSPFSCFLPQSDQLLFLCCVLFAVDHLKEISEDMTQSQYEEKCGEELSQNQNNDLLSSWAATTCVNVNK